MKRFENTKKIYSSKITRVVEENYRIKTIEIDHAMDEAKPGQFLMVWVPGVGERPMSIGNNKPLTISVANVGKVSSKLHELKEGDLISFRGPLGKGFTLPKPETGHSAQDTEHRTRDTKHKTNILLIGGGYGVVPLYFLAKTAKENGIEAYAVIGARTAKDIVWEKQLSEVCKQVFVTTDDGSKGKKGTIMVEVENLLKTGNSGPETVYSCGPERMMEAVAKFCKEKDITCEVSLERYMKCGVGVCGSCAIDGKLCCKDGPVFKGEDALKMADFGKRKREPSGRAVNF